VDDGAGESEDAAPLELSALLEAVESDLLGGAHAYTRHDLAQRSGVDAEEARRLWRALGFASVDDDARIFTDADVDALRNVTRLRSIGDIDEDLLQSMTRIIGQTFARLASWQGQVVLELISRRPELVTGGDDRSVLVLVEELLPVVGELHDYVWRRQLGAFFARVASNAGVRPGSLRESAVGFVDMADFTGFTRRASEADLRAVLTAFETLSTDVVGAHGGQIVKTIGDEVLFVADDPSAGADIALELVAAAERDPVLPDVRAGVAWGNVVSRLGDVYGQTVNIASRLTSVARTGSILVDENLAERLRDRPDVQLHPLRPVTVRGYRHLRAWRLRRAQG
jgi:adenylate cyclase